MWGVGVIVGFVGCCFVLCAVITVGIGCYVGWALAIMVACALWLGVGVVNSRVVA